MYVDPWTLGGVCGFPLASLPRNPREFILGPTTSSHGRFGLFPMCQTPKQHHLTPKQHRFCQMFSGN